MKGTLIVGQASKAGETKAIDHHKMAKKAEGASGESVAKAASNLAQATGKVNSVDAEKHTINVTHDPIKALGWPKMKMEFPVDKAVDFSGIKAGDVVSFALKPGANDDYSVVTLKKSQ
jgi:Cu(I)/Ag(I) efflux system protein CusF